LVVAPRLTEPIALTPALEHVRRAQAGDAAAFAELVDAYQRTVYCLVLSLVRNADDAHDVTQDVWVRVLRHLPQLRDPARFVPWMLRIARNCSMDYHAAQKSRLRIVDAADHSGTGELAEVPDAAALAPEEQIVSLDERRKVWEVLGQLSEPDRTALFLRDTQGLPYS
jgi:RNA polymerase sigma-70 factor (ECF subfamily)